MARPGRNDPCHCGSTKKYKRCCLPGDEAAEHAAQAIVQEAAEKVAAEEEQRRREFHRALLAPDDFDMNKYIARSNAVLDLIHAGHLDEAEVQARELMRDEPEMGDGIEHLGFVCEKRGDLKTAARYYREAAALGYQPGEPPAGHITWLLELADRLDPPSQ